MLVCSSRLWSDAAAVESSIYRSIRERQRLLRSAYTNYSHHHHHLDAVSVDMGVHSLHCPRIRQHTQHTAPSIPARSKEASIISCQFARKLFGQLKVCDCGMVLSNGCSKESVVASSSGCCDVCASDDDGFHPSNSIRARLQVSGCASKRT